MRHVIAGLWAAIIMAACLAPAHAETTVGVHAISTHFREGPNNVNLGGFVRYNGWEMGDYYNSHRTNTFYAGYMFEAGWSVLGLRPALLVVGVTGYGKPIGLGGTVGVSFHIPGTSEHWRGRLEYTRNPDPDIPHMGVLHSRIEYTF